MTNKQKRQTHADRAKELALMGALKSRLVDIEGLSVYMSIPVPTLRDAVAKLPRKWTRESLKAAMEDGIVSPPVRMMGKKIMFDLNEADELIGLLPVLGQLPTEEAAP